ncbi:MAG: hypothetical protein H0Z31_01410 [Bacillus sp. (in: Bacteria)]|nr:hypothetical protein [Bacillus sp. (in: firmicutes)]
MLCFIVDFYQVVHTGRLQRKQEAARPILERSEGNGLRLARGKRPPGAK